MKKLRQIYTSFLLLQKLVGIVIIGCFSASAYSADLLDIYHLALRNDPTFDMARYTLNAAQKKYPQAVASLLPVVNVTGTNNVTRAQNQFSNSQGVVRDVHAWNWSLQLIQPVIRMQSLYAYDEAKVILEQAQANYNLAEQDMILRITQAYFGVLASREGIKVAEAELSATEEQLQLAKFGYKKGVAAITDVRESQARVDLAYSHLVAARNEMDAANAELGKIVDEVPDHLAALGSSVLIPLPQPNNQQHWVNLARENHPAVGAAQAGLLVAKANVGKIRAEHAPTLDAVASYGESYSSGNTTLPTDFASRGHTRQIGLQFSIPIFSGGATNARVAEAMANKYRVGGELELARRQATTDARLAFTGVVNGVSQIMALESAVKSSQSMVDQGREGYTLGIYNNAKVLDAEQQFYTAKRDLVKARYATLFHALKLKAAAGALSETELVNTNALFVH